MATPDQLEQRGKEAPVAGFKLLSECSILELAVITGVKLDESSTGFSWNFTSVNDVFSGTVWIDDIRKFNDNLRKVQNSRDYVGKVLIDRSPIGRISINRPYLNAVKVLEEGNVEFVYPAERDYSRPSAEKGLKYTVVTVSENTGLIERDERLESEKSDLSEEGATALRLMKRWEEIQRIERDFDDH